MSGIAVIVGMRAEAALLPRGVAVACTGGRVARAEEEARRLLSEGAHGLLSFGIAGGLDPVLESGALIIGTSVVVGDEAIACDARWVESLRVALSPSPRPASGTRRSSTGASAAHAPLKGEGEEVKAEGAASPPPLRERVRVGGIAVGPIFSSPDPITYPAEKTALHRRWHALAVDMESGAVARACAAAGKPLP